MKKISVLISIICLTFILCCNVYAETSNDKIDRYPSANEFSYTTEVNENVTNIKEALDDLYGLYNLDIDNLNTSIEEKIPIITAKDVKDNSVTLYAKSELEDTLCYIYRSKEEYGSYERVSNKSLKCDGVEGLIDNNLEKGTTYYYIAQISGNSKYSDAIKITTSINGEGESTDIPIDGPIENPNTFVTRPLFWVIVLGIIGTKKVYTYTKRKEKMHKL